MKERPLRTTVIGSYPFPGWLEFAAAHLDQFGADDLREMQDDAVTVAVSDQLAAGLDVITDGEQTRLDFNLSFYGFLEGIALESASPRRSGPPAHDQRGKHQVTGELKAPRGLGAVEEFQRLQRITKAHGWLSVGFSPALKASIPGPYTLSGRLVPNDRYPNRWSLTESLLPIVRSELESLLRAGCTEICVDEPSMSCYAHKEDPKKFVDIFNRTVAPVVGKCRLSTHLCFGNYKARAVGPRRYAPMFPAFLDMNVDELHLEMASREFGEIEIISEVAKKKDVAVGIIDVKSYYIETPQDVADRVRLCLKHAPADKLSFAPDCGLSQTARWAAKQKLINMVEGATLVRKELAAIKPALQDDAFLADVRLAQNDTNHVHLWWLGQSGYLIQYKGCHLLLDPYLSDSLTKKYASTDKPHTRISERVVDPAQLDFIDVITSSHAHTDHLDTETLRPILAANRNTWLVVPAANRNVVRERVGSQAHLCLLKSHDGFGHDRIHINAVPAAHDKREVDEQGNDRYLGFVIKLDRMYLYHSGDTVRFEHQVESVCVSKRIDVALLPINGKVGNMNGTDAARLAKDIGAKLVIPCHYDLFEFNTADPRELFIPECERIGQPYRVLKLGERLTLDRQNVAKK